MVLLMMGSYQRMEIYLPVAAFAYPSLTGAKDLSTPFKLTIVAGDGTQKEYTLIAKHPNN